MFLISVFKNFFFFWLFQLI
uniref:Uncharacterized protein n=1 Tax=Anguilla anguilla TaxID=7936 RepID=A0A0E9XPY8_ANGAN